MVELAHHNASFPQAAPHEPALRAAPPRRSAFAEARHLGYAPNSVQLAGRQLEVAQMVALGLADKEIAHFLSLSQGTVKSHVSMILRQLGLYRRTQICRFVYEAGLLAQDAPGPLCQA